MRFLFVPVALALVSCGQPSSGGEAGAAAKDVSVADNGMPLIDAKGTPAFTPGLWEIIQTEDGEREVRRECLGKDLSADLARIVGPAPAGCTKSDGLAAGGINVKLACKLNGIETEADLSLTGTKSAFEMKLGLYSIVAGKRNGGVTQGSGRWIGVCPEGMQPGDVAGDVEG